MAAYDQYRPKSGRLAVSVDEWKFMLYKILWRPGEDFDPKTWNSFWFEESRAKALDKVLKRREVTPLKEGKKYRSRAGLEAHHKRPDYARSMMLGGLHFGTNFGYHKEVVEDPRGRKGEKRAGNFVIMIDVGWNVFTGGRSHTVSYGGQSVNLSNFMFNYILAAAWSLVLEAEKRQDLVSIILFPRNWETAYDEVWFTNYQSDNPKEQIKVNLKNRRGKVLKTLVYNPYTQFISGITRGELEDFATKWYLTSYTAEVSPAVFWRSNDYAKIKEFLLRFPQISSGPHGTICSPITLIGNHWREFQVSGERGTIIVVTGTMCPDIFEACHPPFEQMAKFADVFLIDVNSDSHEKYFFDKTGAHTYRQKLKDKANNVWTNTVPILFDKGQRLFNYVHVGSDVSKMTEKILESLKNKGKMVL